ncbi:uncharacterized protein SPSK_05770 [Sporothrix schenckii 1099-18]|uniref:Uncharacterized protein n=1 Tax=Sporothrix schenckii 1099-18 TaxID=1397361 RepID=A0A0F2LSZ6_SPOSC|nr:uncharacterized protein SPSK_05770 [Sporothrix schenckii 1099-18]KJR80613.1 hypothetical protein SPSK_05770 [Sporothrix schenckii 1099-18]
MTDLGTDLKPEYMYENPNVTCMSFCYSPLRPVSTNNGMTNLAAKAKRMDILATGLARPVVCRRSVGVVVFAS